MSLCPKSIMTNSSFLRESGGTPGILRIMLTSCSSGLAPGRSDPATGGVQLLIPCDVSAALSASLNADTHHSFSLRRISERILPFGHGSEWVTR